MSRRISLDSAPGSHPRRTLAHVHTHALKLPLFVLTFVPNRLALPLVLTWKVPAVAPGAPAGRSEKLWDPVRPSPRCAVAAASVPSPEQTTRSPGLTRGGVSRRKT